MVNQLQRWWANRTIGTKLAIVMVTIGTVPVVLTTQILTSISRQRTLTDLQNTLNKDGSSFTREYVEWTQAETSSKANSIAVLINATGLDINNPANRDRLLPLVKIENGADAESNFSFVLVLDNDGRVVASEIRELVQTSNALLPPKAELPVPQYGDAKRLRVGTDLTDIAIIKAAITTQKPLVGIELLKSAQVQKLGLANQAAIAPQAQPTANLPEPKQPFPAGTFDIDDGKIGMVTIAVQPIEGGGMVVAGNMLNRNYGIVDSFSRNFGVDVATIFAQDWRVATNVPYTDNRNRAIGTRVAREVAEVVLKNKATFSGITNIVGQPYLTVYIPLFDHRKILDEKTAPTIGISFVGSSLVSVEQRLQQEQLYGYGIGAIALLVIALLTIPLANSFAQPLQRLTLFSRELGAGNFGADLPSTGRGDEIGKLETDLRQMASQLADLVRDQQEKALVLEQARQNLDTIAKDQQQQKEQLQKRALELLLQIDPVTRGDLTVRATVTSDEVGTIADSYNSVIRSLRSIVTQVQSAAQSVSETAVGSSEAVQAVVADTDQQTRALAEALNQIEAMVQSIQGVAVRAKQAEEVVQITSQVVQEGDQTADRALAGITALKSTVTDTATKVERLGASSDKISKVVKVIRNFAAQTNLLALNASIEAARAGEEGESFAVVAEKVRTLAQQSSSASSEIEAIVENIQTQIREVVIAMTTGAQQAEVGTRLVQEVRQTLTEITNASRSANQLVQEIAQAAQVQTDSSYAVSETMQSVADTSQMTAERSQVVVNSFAKLLNLAENLQDSISQFKIS
jgi:methyl-accepting chemotaxis protein